MKKVSAKLLNEIIMYKVKKNDQDIKKRALSKDWNKYWKFIKLIIMQMLIDISIIN